MGMSVAALLADVTGEALLANGRPVSINPSTPADAPRVRAFYERLSSVSSHYRFLGSRREIPQQELEHMVTCDVDHHVALLASIEGELIGIGEYYADDQHEEAEVAFVVADEHHGEGVATLLLERLALTAQRSGLRRLVAHTLPDNRNMLLVFETIGLTEQTHFDGDVIDVILDLSSLDYLDALANTRHQQALLRSSRG
jgi:RimJ/RimL family protein N-acetyltransferase